MCATKAVYIAVSGLLGLLCGHLPGAGGHDMCCRRGDDVLALLGHLEPVQVVIQALKLGFHQRTLQLTTHLVIRGYAGLPRQRGVNQRHHVTGALADVSRMSSALPTPAATFLNAPTRRSL